MLSKRDSKEALAGGKGATGDRRSEVSQPAKVCTDGQESHNEAQVRG
ncbi:MAG: hypothetical protein ACLFUH_07715 [Bacteroidales bacterium]